MSPYLIAIAGASGAGKTALAEAVAARLERASTIVSLDSYYHPLPHLPAAERAVRNYDHPDALDWTLLGEHLRALLRGETVAGPVYLFEEHTRAARTVRVEARPYVIVEGILALHQGEIRALAELKVFIETREAECLRRRMARDVAQRGRTEESVLAQFRETVQPMAKQFVLPSRAHADVVVSGEAALEEAVAAVVGRVLRERG